MLWRKVISLYGFCVEVDKLHLKCGRVELIMEFLDSWVNSVDNVEVRYSLRIVPFEEEWVVAGGMIIYEVLDL